MLTKRQPTILSDETVRAILAKEALLKAGISLPQGRVTSSNAPYTYVIYAWGRLDSAMTGHRVPSVGGEEDNARLTMFASEAVLRRDWDSPEEDEAWAHL